MQRTSSLDIIELTQKGEFNAVSTKKERKKKKKKEEPKRLVHQWLATGNNYMKELILVVDIMIPEWIISNIDFNRSDFTTHTPSRNDSFHIHNIFFIGHCCVDNFNLKSDIYLIFFFFFGCAWMCKVLKHKLRLNELKNKNFKSVKELKS